MKVVLAGTYPAGTFEKIRAELPEEAFDLVEMNTPESYAAMTDAEIMILRIFKAPAEVIRKNPKLKMIMRWGAGFDSVDIEEAGRHGILVTNTPGANAGAVSELAILDMLMIGRKMLCHQDSLRRGVWSKSTYTNQSFTLNGKVLGIIGAGNIGRQVARKAQAFGAVTQYYDPYRLTPEREAEFHLSFVPLEELIRTSDIITLHVPLTDENRHMIGAEQIAEMKKGAMLINTSRGGLVDDHALAAAVRAGKLAGAGLDVTEKEPLLPEDELLQDPNIVVTPHIGGGTADLGEMIIPMLVKDILDFTHGEPVQHVVNSQYLKK